MPTSPRARSRSRTRGGGRYYAPSAGGGGGGGSLPTSITGLVDWYKADAITGVSVGSFIPAANIVDSSGNAHTFDTLTFSNAATLRSGGYNNRAWADHSTSAGGGYKGASATPQITTDLTFFGIMKVTAAGYQGIMGGGAAAPYLRIATGTRLFALISDNTAQVGIFTLAFATDTFTPFIVTYTKSSGSMTLDLGASSETVAGTANISWAATPTRTLGDRDNASHDGWTTGGWVELGRYNKALSSLERTGLLAYLTNQT